MVSALSCSTTNGAALKRRVNIATRQQLRRDAKLLHHPPAKPEEAHLEALEVGKCLDLLAEPARRLQRDNAADDRFQPMILIDTVHERFAAAIIEPGEIFARRRSNGMELNITSAFSLPYQ